MAVTTQTEEAVPVMRPLTTRYPTSLERNEQGEPFGQVVFTSDAVVLDGSGVGDTARLRLSFPLPDGYGYSIQRLCLTVYTDWGSKSLMEFYVAAGPEIAGASTTQLEFSLQNAALTGDGAGLTVARAITWEPSNQGTPPILFGYDPLLTNTFPTVVVEDTDTAVPASTMSWYAAFLVWELETVNYMQMHWPKLVQSST